MSAPGRQATAIDEIDESPLNFRLPTRVDLEPGCSARLPGALRELGAESALFVFDAGLRESGHPERLHALLAEAGIRAVPFGEVEPNPRTTTAERAAEHARGEGVEGVVGLGGGSVLDAAKAAAMLATNAGAAETFEGRDRFSEPPLPFVAVPTTCGTGSEVTWVAVLTHEPTRRKISIKGEALFPDRALVDAELLRTLPSSMVAATGLDALTHALEAVTSKAANPVSDALAAEAVEVLWRYLPRAAEDVRNDGEAREGVMDAATLAGIAFGNADVGAVHCLSETLGGLWDVPHGLTNAILLAPVLRSHRPHVDARLAALRSRVAGPAPELPEPELAGLFLDELDTLVRRLGIPAFASLGVPHEEYERIAEGATENNSNPSNPRPMGKAEYLQILEGLG